MLTSDHVPPACLFSKPRPSDLVTVPCCSSCNREFMKDDEYFRIAVTTGIDKVKFPRENADSVHAINKLVRPQSFGFARRVLQGVDLDTDCFFHDRGRLDIVLRRISRGLFYYHKGERMPATVHFEFVLLTPSMRISTAGQEQISRLEGNLRTIGQGVFRYTFEPFEAPDPFGTAWLMRFYDNQAFFCITSSE